jgi:hypothetical protein
MIGKLAVSFCGRQIGQPVVCLDLWSYPDGTYNLVVEQGGKSKNGDFCFPCSLPQLAGILDRKSLTTCNGLGSVHIERCGEAVCAAFEDALGEPAFRHCIPIDEYRRAIEALESNVVGYLA